MKNYLKILSIDEYSITPKYLQLSNAIIRAIESGDIVKDDMLPSINDLSFALDTSRNTIERVYKELKDKGIVSSVPGKGFFISNTDFQKPLKIFLLFNKLSAHKKIIYDAFVATIGELATIDFYIYNNDFYFFKKIIAESFNSDYAKYIIIPHFLDNETKAHEIINTIPKDKLILLDNLVPGVNGKFAAIYENFASDVYEALKKLIDKLTKYHNIKLIFPGKTYHSKEILKGFLNFCRQYAFDYEVVDSLAAETIQKDTVYISLTEDDLVELIKKIIASDLKVAKDVGVISYNETALKEIILDGITTISTDFKLMGSKTAEFALSNCHEHFAVPFNVTLRSSL
ncbi:GntR family transcriptional regulator [Mucilaginibacter sp. OK283]|jgi:DNA-binding transcriptional regulator YhcF (GntR family)|uniref:GntR family transcriptional regulator n=1 Tax=Mucilaginibacter sp. OK283 TaxID=1881049 RepID=UPI0008ABB52F|nr:GntR family transcriptional regulator [Mucilaginibacter sp. OK283]SEO81411.1 transcriptional regulator, GntR family [Mucilaginibacter sp. OK283]